jgi:hypothetical protein
MQGHIGEERAEHTTLWRSTGGSVGDLIFSYACVKTHSDEIEESAIVNVTGENIQ